MRERVGVRVLCRKKHHPQPALSSHLLPLAGEGIVENF